MRKKKIDCEKLVMKLLRIQKKIDANKRLYADLDQIFDELLSAGFRSMTIGKLTVSMRDNFKDKNVVFRAAAVRRFELVIK